jgi:hypothetical protein
MYAKPLMMNGFISSARVGADFHSVCVLSALQSSIRACCDSVCVLSALAGRHPGML